MSNNKFMFQKRENSLSRSINARSTVIRGPNVVRLGLPPIQGGSFHPPPPQPFQHHKITLSSSTKPAKFHRLTDVVSADNQILNTINFNKAIEKTYIRSSSLKQASNIFMNPSEKNYLLSIQFLSNWGHPNLITCSEIDILGKDRTPLQKVTISEYVDKDPNSRNYLNPSLTLNGQNLERLTNHVLIKETIESSWSSEWKPKSKTPHLLYISIASSEQPEYIRIWNSKFLPESNLRRFKVFFEKQLVGEGEVPLNFCVVTKLNSDIIKPVHVSVPPLCESTELEQIHIDSSHNSMNSFQEKMQNAAFGLTREQMLSIFQERNDSLECDQYGKIYVPRVKRLTFTLIEAYDPNSNGIGLNSIELFDISGKSISFSSIKTVNIVNATSVSSPFNLFKDHRRTMDSSDMWICEKEPNTKHENSGGDFSDSCPKLTVDLSREKKIVLIRIWNFNGFDEFNMFGVKKMKISSDRGALWRGTLNAAKGMTSKIVDGITDIWLTEKTLWAECPQISEYRTSRVSDSERSLSYSSRESTERSD